MSQKVLLAPERKAREEQQAAAAEVHATSQNRGCTAVWVTIKGNHEDRKRKASSSHAEEQNYFACST